MDLEEAVHPTTKGNARDQLVSIVESVDFGQLDAVVRTNIVSTTHGKSDLEALARLPKVSAVCLPKIECVEDIQRVAERIPTKKLWLCIETPLGVSRVLDLAGAHPNVSALIFGSNDLSLSIGISTTDFSGLQYAQSSIVMAARVFGKMVFDGPSPNLLGDNEARTLFEKECRRAVSLGFDGKLVVHPAQIDCVRTAFTPSEQDIEHAKSVAAAYREAHAKGIAVIRHNGQMIESPHAGRAMEILRVMEQIHGFESSASAMRQGTQ